MVLLDKFPLSFFLSNFSNSDMEMEHEKRPKTSIFYTRSEYYDSIKESNFLESCFLCQKYLGQNKDIFMYRGNVPFCSYECRQEQIEIDDDTRQRIRRRVDISSSSSSLKRSSSVKESSSDQTTDKSSSSSSISTKDVRNGRVVVA